MLLLVNITSISLSIGNDGESGNNELRYSLPCGSRKDASEEARRKNYNHCAPLAKAIGILLLDVVCKTLCFMSYVNYKVV